MEPPRNQAAVPVPRPLQDRLQHPRGGFPEPRAPPRPGKAPKSLGPKAPRGLCSQAGSRSHATAGLILSAGWKNRGGKRRACSCWVSALLARGRRRLPDNRGREQPAQRPAGPWQGGEAQAGLAEQSGPICCTPWPQACGPSCSPAQGENGARDKQCPDSGARSPPSPGLTLSPRVLGRGRGCVVYWVGGRKDLPGLSPELSVIR